MFSRCLRDWFWGVLLIERFLILDLHSRQKGLSNPLLYLFYCYLYFDCNQISGRLCVFSFPLYLFCYECFFILHTIQHQVSELVGQPFPIIWYQSEGLVSTQVKGKKRKKKREERKKERKSATQKNWFDFISHLILDQVTPES